MAEQSNAAFISYRREVGGYVSLALYQHLAADPPNRQGHASTACASSNPTSSTSAQ